MIENSRVLQLTRKNRIPILALGPLLARTGEAEVPVLGGDQIGARPVDIHLEALAKLGANCRSRRPAIMRGRRTVCTARTSSCGSRALARPKTRSSPRFLAHGKTVIKNAASEPEIIDLIKMLQNMGAIIELSPPRTITIEGVKKLRGVTHRILPDRNEAVSFACLAIATRGKILVKGAIQDHLITFLNVVRRMGAEYEVGDEGITFWVPNGKLNPVFVTTDVHPGFMTDWQQPLAVCMTQADGVSSIHETIYEDRFGYANDLTKWARRSMSCRIVPTTKNAAMRGGDSITMRCSRAHETSCGESQNARSAFGHARYHRGVDGRRNVGDRGRG